MSYACGQSKYVARSYQSITLILICCGEKGSSLTPSLAYFLTHNLALNSGPILRNKVLGHVVSSLQNQPWFEGKALLTYYDQYSIRLFHGSSSY